MNDSKEERAKEIVDYLKKIIEVAKEDPAAVAPIALQANLVEDITTDGECIYFHMAFGPTVEIKIEDILAENFKKAVGY